MNKKLFKRIFSLLLCFVVLFISCFNIYATISSSEQEQIDEYKRKQQELQDKIDDANEKIDALKNNIEEKEAYANELAIQIGNFQAQIDILNDRIDDLEKQKAAIQEIVDDLNLQVQDVEKDILQNEFEINETEGRIASIYNALRDRLKEQYVNGSVSELELLFDLDGNDSFAAYLIISEIIQERARQDDKMIKSLNEDIKNLELLTLEYENNIKKLEEKKAEQQVKIDDLNSKETEIVKSRSELEDSQDELVTLQNEAYGYIKDLDAQSNAYKNLVDSYEADIKAFEEKIDDIINSASQGDGNVQSIPGGFIWPLQYDDAYISSPYGYRYDPVSGVYKLHGGTDSCCRSGTSGKAVRASADGTVIISTYHGAYGYYVSIDHGNGIATVYAHNSSLNVSVGQTVKQGDVIAYAGSTGYSTGAHCHFEFRINGTKVDPQSYASLN